ncbi:MAG: hypothetical protein KDD22_01025 [Bdellovibrionales bacterium]|nr:hypothetical protein [Bdellovibrionales bacterium]
MNIARFLAQLFWLGILVSSVDLAVDVAKALRDRAKVAHDHHQIDRAKFTRKLTEK